MDCVYVHVCCKITVKIHEKHSLQSPRASAATPCDAVVSMGYKYSLLSSEGPQHSSTPILHPLLLSHTYTQCVIWEAWIENNSLYVQKKGISFALADITALSNVWLHVTVQSLSILVLECWFSLPPGRQLHSLYLLGLDYVINTVAVKTSRVAALVNLDREAVLWCLVVESSEIIAQAADGDGWSTNCLA